MEKEKICENPKHKGKNPPREKGVWWLKDPEWKMWCPKCVNEWWRNQVTKELRKNKEENEKEIERNTTN